MRVRELILRINPRLFEPLLLVAGVLLLAYGLARAVNYTIEARLARTYYTVAAKEKKKEFMPKKSRRHGKKKKSVPQWKRIVQIDPFKVMPQKEASKPAEPEEEVISPLNAVLLGTIVGSDPEWSYAIIRNNKGQTGVYRLGEEFSSGVTIARIDTDKVVVIRKGKREIIPLFEKQKKGAKAEERKFYPRERASSTRPRPPRSRFRTPEITVVQEDENHFVLDAEEVQKATEDMGQLLTQARIVPYVKNGETVGYKVFAVRPGSIFDKIGLKNGDVIKMVNGMKIQSPQEALELFRQLRDESEFEITIERGNEEKTLYYTLR